MIETPKPMNGTWTLTAPDGRTWQADSPLRCVGAEQRERVPEDLALARVLAAASEPMTNPWQPMKTAPKDGTAVLVLLVGSDVPHAARWLRVNGAPGWHRVWDGWRVPAQDGPRYWMHCPDDPDVGV